MTWHGATVLGLALAAGGLWWLRLYQPATTAPYVGDLANMDQFAYSYPNWHRAARLLFDGELPLWNPFQALGHPFLAAAATGILYPLNVAFLCLPTAIAIEATAIGHLFLAGVFMSVYARTVCDGRLAPIVGGTVFMCSGFVVSQALWFHAPIGACVWLPLGFYALECLARRREVRGVIVLATATAMPLLAGWLQTWTYATYALVLYAAGLVACAPRAGTAGRPRLRLAGLCAAGLFAGVGLAAVQLLPTLELQHLGPRRPGGLAPAQIAPTGAPSPQRMLGDAFGLTASAPRMGYVGVLSLLVLPISLLARRHLRAAVLWLLLLGSVCIAGAAPVRDFFLSLPAAGWFRYPARVLFLAAFAAAALVAVALDVLWTASDERRRGARITCVAMLVALSGAASLGTTLSTNSLAYLWGGTLLVATCLASPRWSLRAGLGMVVAVVLVGELVVATRNVYQRPIHRRGILTAEDDVFDYVKARQGFARTYVRVDPATEIPARADAWAHRGPFYWGIAPKQATLRGIYSVTDYEPLSLQRTADVFALLEDSRRAERRLTPFTGSLALDPRRAHGHLLDLMSVRFLLAHRRAHAFRAALERPPSPWRPAFTGRRYVVYEHAEPLPRAYHLTSSTHVRTADAALTAIARPSFDPRRQVVIEGASPHRRLDAAADREGLTPATIAVYEPKRVVIAADAPAPGHLVLTDTFYPGWRARVDGRAVPIVRANYLFRAVWLEAGRHTVVFTYEPSSVTAGAALSVLTVIVLGAWAVRRRSTAPSRPRRGVRASVVR